jgi:hypothetical protein
VVADLHLEGDLLRRRLEVDGPVVPLRARRDDVEGVADLGG